MMANVLVKRKIDKSVIVNINRTYKLILPVASARVQGESLSPVTSTTSNNISIEKLFEFIKSSDNNF